MNRERIASELLRIARSLCGRGRGWWLSGEVDGLLRTLNNEIEPTALGDLEEIGADRRDVREVKGLLNDAMEALVMFKAKMNEIGDARELD